MMSRVLSPAWIVWACLAAPLFGQVEVLAPMTISGPADPNATHRLPPPDETPLEVLPPLVLSDPGWQPWIPTLWDTHFLDPWEGNVELGLNGTKGNSETFNVRFGMTAKHKSEFLVRTLQVTSIQKSADEQTTANTALVDGRLDWPIPQSRWNYFLHGLAEYDEFKSFDYRLSADTGVGFEWIQTDITMLTTRTGISVSREFAGPNDEVNPELLFGAAFKHKFNPTHAISATADYYPNVTDFGDYRVNSQASWEIALSSVWGLSLKLSIIDRYDSTPEGAKPNDLDYSTLMLWTF